MSSQVRLNSQQVQIVEKAALNRGWIITSYAQVEFLLADLVLRWRTQSGAEQGALPYTLESRIRRAGFELRNGQERPRDTVAEIRSRRAALPLVEGALMSDFDPNRTL